MDPSVIFINNTGESFTPTHSGAIATWLWEMARAAQRSGVTPVVVSPACQYAPYDWAPTKLLSGVVEPRGQLARLRLRGRRKIEGWNSLWQPLLASQILLMLRNMRADASVLVLHNDPELAVFLNGHLPRAYIIHLFHNQHDCRPSVRKKLGRSDVILAAVSEFTARQVETMYELLPGTVKVIYNGVNVQEFTPSPLPQRTHVVLNYLGRLDSVKAPDIFLQAALALAEKYPDFSIQILGASRYDCHVEDEYCARLSELISSLERSGIVVRRLGHVPRAEVPLELSKAEIHVMPSRWDEPFGLVALEGMACGLATVVSRVGGLPEVVGDAALLFERDSVDGLHDCLERLVKDTPFREMMASKARQRAEMFTWDRTWSCLQDLVQAGRN